jgi:hypothetical protein
MAVINTKGVAVYISTGASTPHLIPGASIEDISNTAPATVTLLATDSSITVGDIAYTNEVSSALDGRLYTIGNIAALAFDLVGSDATSVAGPITGITAPDAITVIPASDMVRLCLSQMEFGADTVNNISVGTYCDPAAQIPGLATPGTITLGGYAEVDDPGLEEIMKAAEDQQPRFFQVVLPGSNGYIVGEIALAGFSMSVPLEGAVSWTVTGTQVKKIRWVY